MVESYPYSSCSPFKPGQRVGRSWARLPPPPQLRAPERTRLPGPRLTTSEVALLPVTAWFTSPDSEGSARTPACIRA